MDVSLLRPLVEQEAKVRCVQTLPLPSLMAIELLNAP